MSSSCQFVKRAIPVAVEFAELPGLLETLEGPVLYTVGDALLTGVQGERWTVQRAKFESSYVPASNTKTPENGLYFKRFLPVIAYQVEKQTIIPMQGRNEKLLAKPRDWVVIAPDGNQWVVAQDIFTSTYIPIDRAGEAI